MKNKNNPKRVSFGNRGSVVETWIIDDHAQETKSKISPTEGRLHQNCVLAANRWRTNNYSNPTKNSAIDYQQQILLRRQTEKPINNNTIEIPSNEATSPDSVDSPPSPEAPVWKPKRSQSIESRDNPFVPGGDLSLEAEELLQQSVIIRDKFYLRTQNGESERPMDCVDGVSESISPQSATHQNTSPTAQKLRENGKVEAPASPENVKVDLPANQSPQKTGGTPSNDDSIKHKKKKTNKCCSVM